MKSIKLELILNPIRKVTAVAGILIISIVIFKLLLIAIYESNNSTKIIVYYICCLLSATIFTITSIRFKFKIRYMIAGLAVLSFLYQFIFSRYVHLVYENDLQFYFNNAILLAKNRFKTPALYNALFPTTVTYPAFLAPSMKLFGIRRMIPIIYNQLAMTGLSCMVFLFCKRIMPVKWSLVAGFLICLHPYIIIYSDTCNAELIFCALIFAAFYSMIKANSANTNKYQLIWCLVSAITCGIANLFRPLAVIMIIALALYILFYNVGNNFKIIMLTAVMIGTYLVAGIGNNILQKSITKYDPPSNGFGWNLYIGASEKGKWNENDSKELSERVALLQSPSEIHAYFAEKGFERYRNMGFGTIDHMLKKLSPWFSNEYMANVVTMQSTYSSFYSVNEKGIYLALITLIDLPIFFIALIVCIWIFGFALTSKIPELFPVALYLVGSFLLLMIMEVAPRYTVSFRPLFCILTVYGINKLFCYIKNKM